MPSIFDVQARAELAVRLARLTPQHKPKWGRMNPAQIQKHLEGAAEMAMGRLAISPRPTILKNAFARWLVIHSPVPWPKGAPTAPQLIPDASRHFEPGSRTLIEVMEEAGRRGESAAWAEHPAFGKMTGRDWGVMIWRHTDHHLRQFGI